MTRGGGECVRPVVGVTGPDRGGEAAWWFTRLAVYLAGGHAVRITPRRPHRHRVDRLDALVVGGGADVDPSLYGGPIDLADVIPPRTKPDDEAWWQYLLEWLLFPLVWIARKAAGHAAHGGRDAARDRLEMNLIDQAVRRGLPILGICRGEQLLNVYFGGTLHQRLTSFYVEDPEVRSILPRKRIDVPAGTRLANVLGRQPGRVNALHRQAIDRLGRGLRVAARDRNGIVQAIEHETLPFVLGVQWHPEYLPQVPSQRAIFTALVNAARRACAPLPNVAQTSAAVATS